jgi:hypothetical protein
MPSSNQSASEGVEIRPDITPEQGALTGTEVASSELLFGSVSTQMKFAIIDLLAFIVTLTGFAVLLTSPVHATN